MASSSSRPEGPGRGLQAFHVIQEKLERILRSKRKDLAPYRPEVSSILDALDAVNRDSSGMRRHGHRGDRDVD